jgi:hypothetical protein
VAPKAGATLLGRDGANHLRIVSSRTEMTPTVVRILELEDVLMKLAEPAEIMLTHGPRVASREDARQAVTCSGCHPVLRLPESKGGRDELGPQVVSA